jgi:O-antigen ligase
VIFPIEPWLAVLLFIYPILLLIVRNGTNVCFVFLIISAFYDFWRKPSLISVGLMEKPIPVYGAAMASLCIATLISQAYHMNFALGAYDGPSRFLFAVPIYLMMRQTPIRYLTVIQYGFVGGAIGTIFVAILIPNGSGQRLETHFMDAIHFGDLALILGLISVLTINWDRKDSWAVIGLKIVALLAGIDASIRSGSRGGWGAIPIVFVLWWLLADKRVSRAAKMLGAFGMIGAMAALYFFATAVHERIDELASNMTGLDGNKDTSIGLRLQIWAAAIHLFAQNPIFGVGPDQFGKSVKALIASGYTMTPMAAEYAGAEVHNELLNRAVTLGAFGVISILLIYLVPLGLFIQATRSSDHFRRVAGMLGACFVVSFLVFGLTVEVFNLKTPATFYSLTVAILLAIATNCDLPSRKPSSARRFFKGLSNLAGDGKIASVATFHRGLGGA